jgi:hypothetical protein
VVMFRCIDGCITARGLGIGMLSIIREKVGGSAHKGGKVDSPTHRLPLPPGNIPGTHSVSG